MARLLQVEDDRLLSRGIAFALEKEQHTVHCAGSYAQGYAAFCKGVFDLIVLDIGLPDKSGLELCKIIRKQSDVPIIFLTANDTEQDMIVGFQTGGDDYIAKPFSIGILIQRIAAVLRRSKAVTKNMFIEGEMHIDFDKMCITIKEETMKLTVTEYKLLELLVKNRGQVLTRTIILEKLWDVEGKFVDENALSVNIRRLRQKIELDPKNPKYIVTVFGIGYTWGDGHEK